MRAAWRSSRAVRSPSRRPRSSRGAAGPSTSIPVPRSCTTTRTGSPTRCARWIPGLHCYDVYAGQSRLERFFDEQPGTYLLTDFLVRSFDRTVIQELGLDRHPELRDTYFGHYTRVVWLAQEPDEELGVQAADAAASLGLPLTEVPTGDHGLEQALADLVG